MTANKTPKAVKKLENGSFAVQYSNSKKWFVITEQDQEMFQYIVFWMINN